MNALAIWKRGLTLSKARWQFAPKELREEYDREVAESRRRPRMATSAGSTSLVEQLAITSSALSRMSAGWEVALDALEAGTKKLVPLLAKGHLFAYGYKIPRDVDDTPRRLPADLFDGSSINWKRSTVKGNGLEFAAVRIVDPKWVGEIKSINGDAGDKPRPGRPSMQTAIQEAVEALMNEDALRFDQPMKSHYSLIRERVMKHHPELTHPRGLGDETIRKVLSVRFSQQQPQSALPQPPTKKL